MKRKYTPFSILETPCPICESPTPHRFVKVRLYSDDTRDIDLHPSSYLWEKTEFSSLYPPLYYMQHCSCCHFTANHQQFAEPMRYAGMSILKFRREYKQAIFKGKTSKAIIQELSAGFDLAVDSFVQAIKLHLLAIFQLQLFEDLAHTHALDLGRYSLRLAWLYRDIHIQGNKDEILKQLIPFLRNLQDQWPTVPSTEKKGLQGAAQYFKTTLSKSYVLHKITEEVTLLLLISRIYLYLGNGDLCWEHLRHAQRTLNNFDLAIRHEKAEIRIIEKELGEDALVISRKLNRQVSDVEVIYDQFDSKRLVAHKIKAKKLLAKAKPTSVKQTRALLDKWNIDPKVIADMVKQFGASNKKSMWSRFTGS